MLLRRTLVLAVSLLVAAGFTAQPAQAYNAPGPRWPGKTIRYYNTLPASYDWSLKHAAHAWNRSGASVRFRAVKNRGRSQVVVGFGDTHGFAGYASIGRQPRAYVHLVRGKVRVESRANMGRLIAHEFGHIVGLNHVKPGGCKLMEAAWPTDCREPPNPWLYNCRWLSKDDVHGAIKLYGGKVRKSKLFCLQEPKPPQLRDVRFTGGTSTESPMTVTWTPPSRTVRPGSTVEIVAYEQSRCQGNKDATSFGGENVPVKAGRWVDDSPFAQESGTFCYEVRILNRWGLGAAPFRQLVDRSPVPPTAPVVRSILQYPDEYSDYLVDVVVPDKVDLHVDVSASGQCTTAYDESRFSIADPRGGTQWDLYDVPVGPSCLSFFSVDPEGVASVAVTREVVHAARP